MSLILLLLIIFAVIITLLFVIDLRVKLVFDTEKTYMQMTLMWLYPLVRVSVSIEATKPVLKFYLFKKYLFQIHVKKGRSKSSGMELVKITNPKHIHVSTDYGFSNPSTTGITCGTINLVSQFLNIESIEHNPDFMTSSDYIYLNATANINLGNAITNLLRQRINRRNLSWIRTQA